MTKAVIILSKLQIKVIRRRSLETLCQSIHLRADDPVENRHDES